MHKNFLLILLAVPLMVGCGRSGNVASQLRDATPADSMMYYFGEMQAYTYWQDAATDTILRSDEAREDFIAGFRNAMNMERDNSAYNKGLQLGLRLGIRLKEFERRYGVDFSEEMLASALEYYINNDTAISVMDAQRDFYKIKDRFELTAAAHELGDAKIKLSRRGASGGFEMVSDTLYAIDVTPPTTDSRFKEGDRVAVVVTASTLDGKEIVTRQFPDSITLGEGRVPPVVREAIYTMTDGQTRKFMTTPRTLFGKRYTAYKLPYDEPIVFTVKVQR